MSQGKSSIVAEIQRVTDCRLHIERGSAEVRLFGPDKAVARAAAWMNMRGNGLERLRYLFRLV